MKRRKNASGAKRNSTVWVVVNVSCGVFEDVRAYREESSALQRARIWRKNIYPDYDDVEVFKVRVM